MIRKFTLLVGIIMISQLAMTQTIWGENPGEGDFDGGLNDWTVEIVDCLLYTSPSPRD